MQQDFIINLEDPPSFGGVNSQLWGITNHDHRESSYLRAYKAPVICLQSSVFRLLSSAPLHLSRILYKSTLFMQNKPNFQKSQMNVSIFLQMVYENISDWTLGQNKPNSNPIKPNLQKAKMNANLTLAKDYRKKDDFSVRKNKPNFQNAKNERKRFFTKGL